MSLKGLRVLSLESRRSQDMETLILREGGTPFLAPSVKERAVDDDATALRLIEGLEADRFDLLICMTGAGLGFLRDTLVKHMPEERIGAALRRVTIVSRGPKPIGILRALNVPVHVVIPEPNTWREIVEAIGQRAERRIAVQEYGRPNTEMNVALAALGAEVAPFAVYRWELPDDVSALEEAVANIAHGRIDVVLFTSSIQLDHLLEIARRRDLEDAVLSQLSTQIVIGSIGPVMTDFLTAKGLVPDIVPRHPKMWALVKAAGEQASTALQRKPSHAGQNLIR